MAKPDLARAERVAGIAKLLSDPIRVQVLDLLRRADGQVCQCDLQPLFPVSQPTMSHHLKKLADAGVVEVQRRGKWAYYSIDPTALEDMKTWLS
ncbi:MAG: ArsR/SmtB family transcription factor [Solirubrobacteraceae bacterium]